MISCKPSTIMSAVTDESLQSENDQQLQLCLICCSNVNTNQLESSTELIQKNVQVFFLLKHLLQVPSAQLERNLKECGNPESWICLCEQCRKLVRQAKDLHFQIIKMTKKLKSLKKLIVNKTRSSTSKQNSSAKFKRKEIWKSTRNFVQNYGYISSSGVDLINPFIEGDKLARYLATEHEQIPEHDKALSPSPEIKVEVEPDEDDDDQNDTGSIYNNSYYDDDRGDAEINLNQEISSDSSVKFSRIDEQAPSHLPWSKNRKNKKMVRINGRWKCRYCDKLFGSTRAVYVHENTKHGTSNAKAQHTCDICAKTCSTMAHLNMHRRSVHKIRPDGKPASVPSTVPEDPHSCNLCRKVFKCKANLEIHVKYVHEKVLEHSCHLCEMKFAMSSYLKRHQLTVHKDDPGIQKLIAEGIQVWRCKVKGCRAQFMKKSNLEKHSAKFHNKSGRNGDIDKKRFTCGYCGKGFWCKDYHRTHEMLHKNGNEKPYCCELCGLGFAAPLYLSNHKNRIHKKETEKNGGGDI